MRVLHVSRTMGQGGAEKIVYQLCRDNEECEQVVISCGGAYVEELKKIGVRHYMIPDIDRKNPLLMVKCLFALLNVVIKEHIDVIHTHHRMAAFYGRFVSSITGAKCVYTAHNVFLNKRQLMRFSLKKSCIVAVGDGVKQNLIDFYGIPEKRINVIYNSVKVEKTGEGNDLLSEKKALGKYLIGSIGRLTEQKGMNIFIRAIKEVVKNHPNAIGVIIGDGEDREQLEKLTIEFALSDNVLFLGYQKNVLDIIGQLDFVVLSSRWEGFPLTPIETFSQGKTIIVSDISGNNEIVANGENGIIFKLDDVCDLAAKMENLIEDGAFLKELEKGALNTYQKKYDYEKFKDGYQNLYSRSIKIK